MNKKPDGNFSSILTQARKNRGLSQNSLARAVGINASHLNRIERGLRNPPSRDIVLALAQVLTMNQEETNLLLVSAGYAPEYIDGVVSISPGKTELRRRITLGTKAGGGISRASTETMNIAQRVAEELLVLLDNADLRPRDRKILLIAMEALPVFIKHIHENLLGSTYFEYPKDARIDSIRASSSYVARNTISGQQEKEITFQLPVRKDKNEETIDDFNNQVNQMIEEIFSKN